MKMKAKIIRRTMLIVFLAVVAVACIVTLVLAGLLASAWVVFPIVSLLVMVGIGISLIKDIFPPTASKIQATEDDIVDDTPKIEDKGSDGKDSYDPKETLNTTDAYGVGIPGRETKLFSGAPAVDLQPLEPLSLMYYQVKLNPREGIKNAAKVNVNVVVLENALEIINKIGPGDNFPLLLSNIAEKLKPDVLVLYNCPKSSLYTKFAKKNSFIGLNMHITEKRDTTSELEVEVPTTQYGISASYLMSIDGNSIRCGSYTKEGITGQAGSSPFLAIRIVGNEPKNGSPQEIRSNYAQEFSEMCNTNPIAHLYDEANSDRNTPRFQNPELPGDNVIIVVPKDERLPIEAQKSRVFYRSFARKDESATPCDGQKYTIDFEDCDIIKEEIVTLSPRT